MAYTLSPYAKIQFFDNDGEPAVGYQLFTYTSGGSVKTNTYTTSVGTPNTNPIILDAAGRAVIYLDPGVTYRFVMATPTDTDPPASPIWDIDPVNPVPSSTTTNVTISGTAGENLTVGDWVYVSEGDGGNTDGRWYRTDADFDYASLGAKVVGVCATTALAGAATTIQTDGTITTSGLVAGDPYYLSATVGQITNVNPGANARVVGVAESATVLAMSNRESVASTSIAGIVSIGTQSIAGAKTLTGAFTNSSSTSASFGYPITFTTPGGSESAYTSGRIDSKTSSQGNSSGGNTDMYTYTLPAGMLANDGAVIRMTAWGTFAANGNTKVLNAVFGATSVQMFSAATNNFRWRTVYEVMRVDGTNQLMSFSVVGLSASFATTPINSFGGSPAETLSGSVVMRIVGPTATASNDIVLLGGYIELLS